MVSPWEQLRRCVVATPAGAAICDLASRAAQCSPTGDDGIRVCIGSTG